MIRRACSSSRARRAFLASSTATRFCSGVERALRPRRRPSASSAPASRSRRQLVNCELYSASRRSSAPISPEPVSRSASPNTASLYAASNLRRLASALTSGSGLGRAAGKPALAGPAPAAFPAATSAFNATIFSFFLDDIVDLPFDSNSTKVGVSPYIGTNGTARPRISAAQDTHLHAPSDLKCIKLTHSLCRRPWKTLEAPRASG